MNKHAALLWVACSLLMVGSATAQSKKPEKGLATPAQRGGYALGEAFGKQFKPRLATYEGSLEPDRVAAGFRDGISGKPFDAKLTGKGYLLGHYIGRSERRKILAYQGLVDGAAIAAGFRDACFKTSRMTREQSEDAIFELQERMIQRLPAARRGEPLRRLRMAQGRARQQRARTRKRRAMAEAFLAANKKKPGVKTTASGLQYQVLKAGTGKQPQATDLATVHFIGKKMNGKEFENTRKANKPATFRVDQGIPGWTEAVKMMRVGAKWRVVIPYGLAYGKQGKPPYFGPFACLEFEIELLDIPAKKKPGK